MPGPIIYENGQWVRFDCNVCLCRFATDWIDCKPIEVDEETMRVRARCPFCERWCYAPMPDNWYAQNK